MGGFDKVEHSIVEDGNGTITIPQAVMDEFGLHTGDTVTLQMLPERTVEFIPDINRTGSIRRVFLSKMEGPDPAPIRVRNDSGPKTKAGGAVAQISTLIM